MRDDTKAPGAVQHTPGPWQVTRYVGHEGRKDCAAAVAIDAENGQSVIAGPFSFWALRGATEAEAKANAQLIATAPKLLDACREALEYMERNTYPSLMRDRLAAVITEATGGEHA